jgi:uncharacterized protein (TIGR02611 family)
LNTFHHAKRIVKITLAFTVLTAGILMLVLPGPGLVVIALALAMLASEFVWARRLLDRMKAGATQVKDRWTQRRAG